jgi:hypothetical protein
MDKLTAAQLFAGYAPIAGGVALAAMSTTLAVRYQVDPINVGAIMFGGFVGGVAVVGAALSEIAYHWPRRVVSPVVSPPDIKPPTPNGYNTINTRYSQEAHGLIEIVPDLPPYFNPHAARRVAWRVIVRGERLTQAMLAQVMSKPNAAKLSAWMIEHRLLKWHGRDYRAGVDLTGAGRDWLEDIKTAFGAPPPGL